MEKSELKVGDKVKILPPGHVCANKPEAKIYSLEVIGYPESVAIILPNGVITNCHPSKLSRT